MEQRRALRGDCASCHGLCCVSLGFDRSQWFGFDKAADEACRHLTPTNRCGIHRNLEPAGHAGCVHYDCYGAGQRITQDLFPGISWRRDVRQASRLFAAFRRLKDVHELLLLLNETRRWSLPTAQTERREQLWAVLEPQAGLSARSLAALDVAALGAAVHHFLRSLRAHLPPETHARRRLPLVR